MKHHFKFIGQKLYHNAKCQYYKRKYFAYHKSNAPIFQEMPIVKVTFDDKKQKIQWVCEGLVCDGLLEYWSLCREQKDLGLKYPSLKIKCLVSNPSSWRIKWSYIMQKEQVRLESPPTVKNTSCWNYAQSKLVKCRSAVWKICTKAM